MPTPITDKHEMYRRLNAGLLGQTLPSAETKQMIAMMAMDYCGFDFKNSPKYEDKVWAVRSKKANSSCKFNLSLEEAYKECIRLGEGNYNFSPMLDDTKRICYGHLYADTTQGWHLHYTTDPKPARLLESKDGCKQRWLDRTAARLYIKTICDDIGYDTITELVELYPDHCIEFTVMSSSLEAFGKSNTIIWEVRCLTGEYERSTFGVK